MEKKRYKTPVTRWLTADTEEYLYDLKYELIAASDNLDYIGRQPENDDPDNQFSKDADSWEMDW